jgi:hypothetical protein
MKRAPLLGVGLMRLNRSGMTMTRRAVEVLQPGSMSQLLSETPLSRSRTTSEVVKEICSKNAYIQFVEDSDCEGH